MSGGWVVVAPIIVMSADTIEQYKNFFQDSNPRPTFVSTVMVSRKSQLVEKGRSAISRYSLQMS